MIAFSISDILTKVLKGNIEMPTIQKGFLCISCLIIPLIFFISCRGNNEKPKNYFIGQIEYSYNYSSDFFNIDSLKLIKPWKSEFRYDLKNYQSKFIGKDTIAYYYSGNLNKCLSMANGVLDSLCEDYGIATDSIISFKVYDTNEKILGYECKIIEFQSKLFWNRYYVSKDLILAPATYNRHISYNWSFYGEKTQGGLILKLEHRFKKYTMYGIASGIKPFSHEEGALQINEKLFDDMCFGIRTW